MRNWKVTTLITNGPWKKEGYGSMNNNGDRLVEFCATYDLVTGETLFSNHEIHKLTWCPPNGRDKNQINHLMTNGTWKISLQDVRVRGGAKVGSNHHLVKATLTKTEEKWTWKGKPTAL